MATKAKGINRRKLAAVKVYTFLVLLVVFGGAAGFFVGRLTTSDEVDATAITETVTVPTYVYVSSVIPETEDVTYFSVPLSQSLQDYIYEICTEEDVPVALIIAMIDQESSFDPEVISGTNDYGLMQINEINHAWLEEEYRCDDMLDPYQNVYCGIKMISACLQKYDGDYEKALMAYNMGDYGASKAWSNGIESTEYTDTIMGLWAQYEEELENAESIIYQ